jgi:hypothetical protein
MHWMSIEVVLYGGLTVIAIVSIVAVALARNRRRSTRTR